MTVVKAINGGFIKHIQDKKKELLPIINGFANIKPEDVSPEDLRVLTEICKYIREIDTELNSGWMTDLIRNDPNIVSNSLAKLKNSIKTPSKTHAELTPASVAKMRSKVWRIVAPRETCTTAKAVHAAQVGL